MSKLEKIWGLPVVSGRKNEISVRSPLLRKTSRIMLIGDYHSGLSDAREKPYEQYSRRMAQYSRADMVQLQAMFRRAAEEKFDLIMLLGDILSFPSEAGVEYLAELIRCSPVPALFTAGNHDWHYEGIPGSDRAQREEWTAKRLAPLYSGRDPLYYSETVNDIEVAMIDNSIYEILPEQLSFMRRKLAEKKPVILGCHIPLYLPLSGHGRGVTNFGCGHPEWGGAADPYWQIERRERWHENGLSRETFDFCKEVLGADNLLGIAAGHTHLFSLDFFRGKFQVVVSQFHECVLELGPPER